jgi:PAS domain S-box-containing protein
VLAADFFMPLGVALGMLYVLVVLISGAARTPHAPLGLAAVATLFIVIAWYASPFVSAREAEIVTTNRALSILAVWAAAVLLAYRVRAEQQRNRAFESLRLSEARAVAMVETALDCVITIDARGRVLAFNPVAEKTFGYRCEYVVGKEMAELIIPPSLRERHRDGLARCFATGEGFILGRRVEMPAIRADGTEFPVELTVTRLPTDGPAIFTGYLRDITERKQAEETLRKSEDRLRNAIAAADVGTWRVDLRSGLDTRDASLNQILGLEACDSTQLAEDFFSRVHPDDKPRADQAWRSMVEGEIESYEVEVRIVRPDGEERWIRDRGAGIRDGDGKLRYVTGAAADITERRRAEEALRDRERRYELVLAGAEAAIWDWDVPAKRVVYSPRWKQLRGLSDDEVTDQEEEWSSRIHPEDRERVMAAVREHFERRTAVFAEEYRIWHKDRGWIWILDRGRAMTDASGRVIRMAGSETDITERKAAEEALREANRRKDKFLATLSHELRNPLAPLRTGLELMRMVNDDPAKVQECRAIMERQVEHLIRLVDDLLDVSRITRGRLELKRGRIELAAVVQSALQDTERMVQSAGHTLNVNIRQDPIVLFADPVRLAQILTNLLSNAAKYTPNGGRIVLTAERQAGGVALTVRDNGCGIPADKLQSVFETFGQIDRSLETGYRGLGVGLGLVKSLVEMHGGMIEARSDGVDQGSEFRVWLPTTTEADIERSATHGDAAPAPAPALIRQRVLLVDDNRDAAHSLATLVELLGHEVRVAYDGAEALEVAAEFRPQVVLLDIGLPKMNGYDVARRIREQAWGEGVVLAAVTGWGQDHDREQAREAGFDRHLTKPVQLETVRGLLHAVAHE